jgi:hypothetical protein
MTSETLDLFIARVGFMQLHAVGMLILAETVAIQAYVIVNFGCFMNLFFMARIFTACLIGNKFGVVNCNQTTLYELVGHLVAICTARLNRTVVGSVALEEVARKTGFIVNREVFIPFEMTVACAA